MPNVERDIIIYDIVDNEIIHEEIKEEVLVKAFNENDLTNDWRKKL